LPGLLRKSVRCAAGVKVPQDEIRVKLTRQSHAVFASFRFREAVSLERQHVPHEPPVLLVILDE